MVQNPAYSHDDMQTRLLKYELTEREKSVALLWVKDFTHKEIAVHLFISEHTVRTIIKNLYRKLKVNSKASFILRLIENEKEDR